MTEQQLDKYLESIRGGTTKFALSDVSATEKKLLTLLEAVRENSVKEVSLGEIEILPEPEEKCSLIVSSESISILSQLNVEDILSQELLNKLRDSATQSKEKLLQQVRSQASRKVESQLSANKHIEKLDCCKFFQEKTTQYLFLLLINQLTLPGLKVLTASEQYKTGELYDNLVEKLLNRANWSLTKVKVCDSDGNSILSVEDEKKIDAAILVNRKKYNFLMLLKKVTESDAWAERKKYNSNSQSKDGKPDIVSAISTQARSAVKDYRAHYDHFLLLIAQPIFLRSGIGKRAESFFNRTFSGRHKDTAALYKQLFDWFDPLLDPEQWKQHSSVSIKMNLLDGFLTKQYDSIVDTLTQFAVERLGEENFLVSFADDDALLDVTQDSVNASRSVML